jgi:hypothetical protein
VSNWPTNSNKRDSTVHDQRTVAHREYSLLIDIGQMADSHANFSDS